MHQKYCKHFILKIRKLPVRKWEKGTTHKDEAGVVTYLIDISYKNFQKHIDLLHTAYMDIEVDNEHFCENSSAVGSFSESRDSNWTPTTESNIEVSVPSENGEASPTFLSNISSTLTPTNFENKLKLVTWVIPCQFCTNQRESKNCHHILETILCKGGDVMYWCIMKTVKK